MNPSLTLVVGSLMGLVAATADLAAEKVTFEEHVRPILRQHCAGCHNQDDAASDFAVDGYDATLAGGAGGDAVAAGDADGSRLWRMVNHDEQPVMPPGGDKVPVGDLKVLRAWIEGGLLRDAGSTPAKRKKSAISAVDPSRLGKPVGEPAMPVGVFCQPVLTSPSIGPVETLAASPWAPLIAVPWQRQVSLYHVESSELLGVVPYLDGTPRVVRFSRDGSLLLIAGGQDGALGTAALYDVASGARLATVGDEVDTVLAADLSPDNRLVAIGGPKKKVRVYRVADGSLAYTCEKHTDWITSLAFSPDGELLATGDRAAGLRLWSARGGHERADLRGHKQAISAVAWRRDGGLLASASEDGGVRLWTPDGKQIKSWNAHGGGTRSVAFAADGRLVTAGRDRRVKLWKADGGGLGELVKTKDIALSAVFTHDDSRVVLSDWTGAVQTLDLATKKPLAKLAPNPPTLQARLVAAGAEVARREVEVARAEARSDEALAALEAGRERYAQHDARLEEVRLAEADAAAALQAAEATAAQREGALSAVRAALAEVEATFVAVEVKVADADPEAEDFAALESQAKSARLARDATGAAAKEAEALRDAANAALEAERLSVEVAATLVAQVENQVSGLPELAPLESAVEQHRIAVDERRSVLSQAQRAELRRGEELAQYESAAESLAKERQAAAERLAAAQRTAATADERRAAARAASNSAQAELERLKTRLTELRNRLKSQRTAAGEANAELKHFESAVEAAESDLGHAARAARLSEARAAGLKALRGFRAER